MKAAGLKRRRQMAATYPYSKTFQYMESCPQTSINTGFLYTIPTFVHNHLQISENLHSIRVNRKNET